MIEPEGAPQKTYRGIPRFFGLLLALGALQIGLGFLTFPAGLIPFLNLAVSVIFVATPILAIFVAASDPWDWKLALLFLVFGAAAHFGIEALRPSGVVGVLLSVVRQLGLISWCMGLGALLSTLIRERNLIVPIAIFLALLDMFLVLTPVGLTQKMLTQNAEASKKVLYNVPAPKVEQPKGEKAPPPKVEAQAYVGPADFLFLGMFFVALFRFQMRTQETLRAIIPVLAAYLLIVLLLGSVTIGGVSLGALPALLPIGATIFIVNRKEFVMTRDEIASTAVIAGLGLALLIYGATRPRKAPRPPATTRPAAPSPSAPAPKQS